MKILLVGLLLAGGYVIALSKATDQVLAEMAGTHEMYSGISETADKWSDGDTSADFVTIH